MTEPCPKHENGKHQWRFLKNGARTTMIHGPIGSRGHAKLIGIYDCECGAQKEGRANHNAPGADLREHLPGELGLPRGDGTRVTEAEKDFKP